MERDDWQNIGMSDVGSSAPGGESKASIPAAAQTDITKKNEDTKSE